ncbi:MAG: hypothetical protein ACRENH_06880 [Gemmatimonadaceae bacterium]
MSVRVSLLRLVAVLLLVAASTTSLRLAAQTATLLDRIDFREKYASHVKLPRALQEISGLAVTSDGRVFAHGDERAIVVQIDACAAKAVKSFALGAPPVRGDFEGIAVVGERFFLVTSTGRLYEFREGPDASAVPFSVRDTGFGKVCEIEGLAYDPGDRALLMGCKQPLRRELRAAIHVLRWSLDRSAAADPPSLTIPLGDVVKNVEGKAFHTSAIERDARSGHYLLVAGPERAIAEVTAQGSFVAARDLRRPLHPQPEGLTLLGDSVLVIGDEGANGRASITCYRRQR